MAEFLEILSDFHVEWAGRATLWIGLWILGIRIFRLPWGTVQHAIWAIILSTTLILPFARWPHPKTLPTDNIWHAVETAYIALDSPITQQSTQPVPTTLQPPNQWQPTSQPVSIATILGGIYILCISWMSLKLAIGYIDIKRLIHQAQYTNHSYIQNVVTHYTQTFHIQRAVTIKISSEIDGPITTGWRKPVIVLPEYLIDLSSTEDLDYILIHELAHIRRHDFVVTCIQRFCEALLFYHPLVWYVSHHITLHRELACDDWVLTHNPNRQAYAMSLIERVAKPDQTPRLAATYFGAPGRLTTRIQQIMNAHRHIKLTTSRKSLGLTLACITLGISLIGCFAFTRTGRLDPQVQNLTQQALTAARSSDITTADHIADLAAGKALAQSSTVDRKRNLLHVLQIRAAYTLDQPKRRAFYTSALDLANDLNDLETQADLHLQLSANAPDSVRQPHLKVAQQLYAMLDNRPGEGKVLFQQAFDHLRQQKYDRAQSEFNRVASLLQTVNPSLSISAIAANDLLSRPDHVNIGKKQTGYAIGNTVLHVQDGTYTYLGEGGNTRSFSYKGQSPVFSRSPFHEAGLIKKMLDTHQPTGSRWGDNVHGFGKMPLQGYAMILNNNATVTTPAGTFTGCYHIRIHVTQNTDAENKRVDKLNKLVRGTRDVYYAPGVGLVKMSLETKNHHLADLLLTRYNITQKTTDLLPLDIGNTWAYTWKNSADDMFNEQVFQVCDQKQDIVYLSRYHLYYPKEGLP